MIGRHCAATARRNVSARSNEAWSEGGRGKGLMKTIRSLGCVDAWWFRRSVLKGMVYCCWRGEAELSKGNNVAERVSQSLDEEVPTTDTISTFCLTAGLPCWLLTYLSAGVGKSWRSVKGLASRSARAHVRAT